jgi:uncharacterized protein (TIGR02646 family)
LENEDWQPSWGNLQKPERPIVHDSLLKEQGSICCYCGMRIARETSHIEHLKPRTKYPDLAIAYTNLMASCQGESEEPLIPVHCGHKKKYWYDEDLMVSPLEINCADFFKYTGAGEIQPRDDTSKKAAAEATIDRLGLNIDKLKNMRRIAIDAVLQDIDQFSPEEIQQLAQSYEQLDNNGEYTPFCAAIAYIIQNYF